MRLFLRVVLPVCCLAAAGVYFYAFAADRRDDSRPKAADVDTADLLQQIKEKQRERPEGTTRRARMNHLARINQTIVDAAEKIAQSNPDDQTATIALKAELDALSILKRLDDDDAADKLDALTKKLKNDKRPAIVNFLKLDALARKIEKLDTESPDPDAVSRLASDFNDLLETGEPDEPMAGMGHGIMNLLINTDRIDEATALGRALTSKLATSDHQPVQEAAASIASFTGQMMEYQGQEAEAIDFYNRIAKQLLDSNDELKEAVEPLERALRKLALIGQPMSISGKRVDGEEFDLSEFKGKVVLVDFWATWCGPCVRELPNVKEVYDEYHDRGFDVIGISLDSDASELKQFLREEHIRWPILFEDDPEHSGWENPLAEKYEVSSIPFTALIDRQGKVVTLSARGERLGKLVSELVETKVE